MRCLHGTDENVLKQAANVVQLSSGSDDFDDP